MHAGGEGDLRACYTAMAVAHMLCLDKEQLLARSGMLDYVGRCQVPAYWLLGMRHALMRHIPVQLSSGTM